MNARIVRDIVYATRDNHPLTLDLYGPAKDEPRPVIMLVHGGGWCLGDKVGPDFSRYFVEAGYCVADVSYRLAPVSPFPAACDDVQAAAEWLVAHAAKYAGDPAHLGAYGVSAGAHLVAWLCVQARSRLTCAVAWAGPMDFRHEPVTTPYRSYGLAFMGACPHDAPDLYAAASPICQVTSNMPPLLLIHGKEDSVVPAEQARRMQQAAHRVGARVEALVLDGVEHTGGDPQDPLQQLGWQAMMDFYRQHLCEPARSPL